MKITFSGTLLRFVNFQKSMMIDAETIENALRIVSQTYPKSGPVLYDANGSVKKVHQLFLNGKQINHDDLQKAVSTEDRLDVMTAIAGG